MVDILAQFFWNANLAWPARLSCKSMNGWVNVSVNGFLVQKVNYNKRNILFFPTCVRKRTRDTEGALWPTVSNWCSWQKTSLGFVKLRSENVNIF